MPVAGATDGVSGALADSLADSLADPVADSLGDVLEALEVGSSWDCFDVVAAGRDAREQDGGQGRDGGGPAGPSHAIHRSPVPSTCPR